MKKTYFLIIGVLSVATAWAQPAEVSISDFDIASPFSPLNNISNLPSRIINSNHRTALEVEKQRLDSFTVERWENVPQDWELYAKSNYFYDESGKDSLDFFYLWNSHFNEWRYSDKNADFVYDEEGKVIKYQEYDWDNFLEKWIVIKEFNYDYNIDGQLKSIIIESFNQDAEMWENDEKIEYSYEVNGQTWVYHDWDEETAKWIVFQKLQLYDELSDNDAFAAIERFIWDESTSDWRIESKLEYSYYPEKKKTEAIVYNIDESNTHHPYLKREYSYDENYGSGYLILPITQDYNAYGFRFKMNTMKVFIINDGDWYPMLQHKLYYSTQVVDETITGIDALPANKIHIFPNPTSDRIQFTSDITLRNAEIKLIDIHGRTVLSQPLKINKSISVRSLSTGLYVYEISHEGGQQKGKIRIE